MLLTICYINQIFIFLLVINFSPRVAKTAPFIILLCLTPDDFTHQEKAYGWERVKIYSTLELGLQFMMFQQYFLDCSIAVDEQIVVSHHCLLENHLLIRHSSLLYIYQFQFENKIFQVFKYCLVYCLL